MITKMPSNITNSIQTIILAIITIVGFYLVFKQIKNLRTTDQRILTDVLYANMEFNNASEINALLYKINQLKTELSSEQTKGAGKVLPINVKRKSFPSEKLGLLLGLFLGSVLGFFVSLFRNMKIN